VSRTMDTEAEGSDLGSDAGFARKTNDPVRMYLREMGTVPLLTREGEVTSRSASSAGNWW